MTRTATSLSLAVPAPITNRATASGYTFRLSKYPNLTDYVQTKVTSAQTVIVSLLPDTIYYCAVIVHAVSPDEGSELGNVGSFLTKGMGCALLVLAV